MPDHQIKSILYFKSRIHIIIGILIFYSDSWSLLIIIFLYSYFREHCAIARRVSPVRLYYAIRKLRPSFHVSNLTFVYGTFEYDVRSVPNDRCTLISFVAQCGGDSKISIFVYSLKSSVFKLSFFPNTCSCIDTLFVLRPLLYFDRIV